MIVVAPDNAVSAPYRIIARDLISSDSQMIHPQDDLAHSRSLIRHDPIKLAAAVIEVLSERVHVEG